jgi:hypothetical protein
MQFAELGPIMKSRVVISIIARQFDDKVSLWVTARFNNDGDFRSCVEIFSTLPLVPINELLDAWLIIRQT